MSEATSHVHLSHDRCCHDGEGNPRKGLISRWRARGGGCCHSHTVDEGARRHIDERTAEIDERLAVLEAKLLVLAPEEITVVDGRRAV